MKEQIPLFDDAVRTSLKPKHESQSWFSFYNSSARPHVQEARDTLGGWYNRYPLEHSRDLRERFRSDDDRQNAGAFFELLLHEAFLRKGLSPRPHCVIKEMPGKTPDFLISDSHGDIIVEAAALTWSDEHAAASRRIAAALDSLNALDHPQYFIMLCSGGLPTASISCKKLKHAVRAWLDSLDAEQRRISGNASIGDPVFPWSEHGWHLEFRAVRKTDELKGMSGVRAVVSHFQEMSLIEPEHQVSATVARKAERYRNVSLPMIVALYDYAGDCSLTDAVEGLFGRISYSLDSGSQSDIALPQLNVGRGSALFGPKRPQNSNVSAVLLCGRIGSARDFPRPILIHNPHASRQITTDRLPFDSATMDMATGTLITHSGLNCFEDLWPQEQGGTKSGK